MTQATEQRLGEAGLRTLLADLGNAAHEFRFEVAPNPCVGAAVLAGSIERARGFHRRWGGDHAEVEALGLARAQVFDDPEESRDATVEPDRLGDTLVVTLEPCSSEGKTPPCVDLVLRSGIRRVVVGELDPDPRHRGRGLELLREAGIEVLHLPGAVPLERVSSHFLRANEPDRLRRPRPWALAKWAQTRTGQLSPPKDVGDGRWISGTASLGEVHRLRSSVDAIVSGVGTVLADNPRFTVRPPGDLGSPPRRIILDSYLRTPPEARLLDPPGDEEAAGPLTILCLAGWDVPRHRALVDRGAEIVGHHSNAADSVKLWDAQTWMWEQGIRRVMIEAGPRLLTRFFDLGFIDQMRVYTGPVNGGRGPSLADRLDPRKLLERMDRESGDDAVLEAFVRP